MRIAGFNLGTRFTIDDFDTASDIIKGDIRISLGSLEDSEEAKETRSAILDMVEELRGSGSGSVAEGVMESVILGENSEVKASQHNSGENDVVTVAEFSTMGTHLPQGLSNIDIVEENNITEEDDEYFGSEDSMLDDEEDDYFGDDTSEEEVDTSENNSEVYGDDDEEDDYDFEGMGSASIEDEEPEEEYIDPIDAEIQRILGSKPTQETKVEAEKPVQKPVVENKVTQEIKKTAPVVSKPTPVVKAPIPNGNTTNQGNSIKKTPVAGGVPQPIKKVPVNNGNAQPIIKKPINNNGSARPVVKKPTANNVVQQKKVEKPDYISMPIKEVYTRYVKAFMVKNGVQRGVVDGKLLTNEFGAEIVLKLSRGGYILKRGSGYTMGL